MKIYVAGHRGLVGSALVRAIEAGGEHTWIGKTRSELDLTDANAVNDYVSREKPDAIIMAAAKVGGIMANVNDPVGFLTENLKIQTSVIEAAHQNTVPKLIFLGSSCIYPKDAPQPIKEEYLLTGPLEPTNQSYALAKIAGIQMVNSYRKQFGYKWISLMPTNLYGPNDNFDPATSHVIPGLITKVMEAIEIGAHSIEIWGTGEPLREFLHVDDLAEATIRALDADTEHPLLNVGSGEEVSIKELAATISEVFGFRGEITNDASKPDGTYRKCLDSSKISDFWTPKISLRDGLKNLRNEWKLVSNEIS